MRSQLLCLAVLSCALAAAAPSPAAKILPGLYLAVEPLAPLYGDMVTIGALVQSGAAPVPTGTVELHWSGGSGTIHLDDTGHGALTTTLPAKTYQISGVYSGDMNYLPALSRILTFTVGKTGTMVTVGATPAQLNQPVTLTATLAMANWASSPLSGTVSFTADGSPISGCTATTLLNRAATCTTTFSRVGTVSISAAFAGDSNTNSSSGSMPLTVGRMAASIYLASSPDAPVYGGGLTISALVLGARGTMAPTGTVTFSENGNALGAVPLRTDSRASLTPALRAGLHTIEASYSGDTNYSPATAAALRVQVVNANTRTTLAASTGGPFVATVAPDMPGAGIPTGTVTFRNAGVSFANVLLVNGTATIAATTQAGTISAVYSGDANFNSSTSAIADVAAPLAQVVLTSDRNPSIAGQPVTFAAYVTPGTGKSMPTGTVQFSDNGTIVGRADLNSGHASFTCALAAGAHSILGSYSGDTVYAPASATLTQTAAKTATSVTISAGPKSAVFGQPVTLTAQSDAPAGDVVRFLDGTNVIGSAPISGSSASLTVSSLSAASHLITAETAGDDLRAAATSAPLAYTVEKARTSTFATAAGAALAGSVTALAPGAGTPTGTVRFLDGASNSVLATAALAAGSANAPIPSSGRSIIAIYSGDANFLASVSRAFFPLAAVNAASYTSDAFAPDELVTLFAANLSSETASAFAELALTLAGTSVKITDSAGTTRPARLLFVSPSQASILLPPELAPGPAVITMTTAAGQSLASSVTIAPIAPGLFLAGQVLRVHADGTRDAPRDLVSPIDLGDTGDHTYLVLYATGVRHFAGTPVCIVGSQTIPVDFAGPQGGFAGLDQINVLLPAALRGSGGVSLKLMVDGVTSNTIPITFL